MMTMVQEAQVAAKDSSFDVIAKEYNASLHNTGVIKPGDSKKMQKLEEKGLPSRTMLNLDKEGAIIVHNRDRVSFLIKLDTIDQYSQNELFDAQNDIKMHLVPSRMKAQVESFVASLHRNATIETNESILIAGEEYSK